MASTLIQSSLEKINSFFQDVQYHSLMVNSASFNIRLMRDRKTRLPFLDSQTGIAQSPCKLYMSSRHRMPGIQAGQLYAYPAQRWCRRKRSYLTLAQQANRETEAAEHTIVTVENPAATIAAEETTTQFEPKVPEIYYYDETSFLEEEEEEPDNEDDDTYSTRAISGRKRRKAPKPKGGPKGPRGRKKREPSNYKIITDAEDDNPGKPYECSRPVNVNRKTNGGKLIQEIQSLRSPAKDEITDNPKDDQFTLIGSTETELSDVREDAKSVSSKSLSSSKEKKRATPNTYCDFCLGNTNYNVKTGEPEEMVSCADCGRSGQTTVL